LGERQMTGSSDYCVNGFTFVRLEGFGHWLPIDASHEVAQEIVKFLRRG